MFEPADFERAKTRADLIAIADEKNISLRKTLRTVRYEEELRVLQTELVNLQRWIEKKKLRVAIVFEGQDTAGKGGTIKRFVEHLNPRSMRVVALSKPTETERGQWYFQRYIKQLPNPGEIVLFDRSWYNRAVVEPVMGFCSVQQHQHFMRQVPEFEHILYEDGIHLIKFWFSISKKEQLKRLAARQNNPLKRWKFSPVDQKGQELWDKYTLYKEKMFSLTHTPYSPWVIVQANSKKRARLESIRYVLSNFEYTGKGRTNTTILPDPKIVNRYFRPLDY